ncbi:MAG: histidine--tRNA ligase [Planctomycetota bacterium]|nr:MAG: histidine--tRNA ligase [Planctomycetota bacterium]
MSTHAFQAPKGTRDFYPSDLAVRRHIEHAWRSASIDCGFDEVEGPAFEHLELYTAKSGEGIVNELFSFRRAGGENDYALRPEFTPTLARMVAARAGALPVPVKWFAIPNMFRAERPQRGRLREFVQWNIDTLGVEGAATDIDVIACAILALERLGLTPLDVQVRLSHRVAIGRLLSALGVSEEKSADAMTLLDRRDKLKPDEFATRAQALGLSAEGVASFDLAARATQPLADEISALATKIGIPVEALAALDEVRAAATRAGILEWCTVDIGIVRGLAYYTGTVFEIHEISGAERAVAGGGRYDGLVELFGGPKMAACGFGMGDVVLANVLRDRKLLPDDGAALLPRPDAFVISAGSEAAEAELPRLMMALRRAGFHARSSSKVTRNVGKLLGDAGKARARFAVILGAELTEGQIALKNLDSGSHSGSQTLVALAELTEHLRVKA